MTTGIYRLVHPQLGECARVDWGANPAAFLTKDTYEANRHDPPFDELPTKEEYHEAILNVESDPDA